MKTQKPWTRDDMPSLKGKLAVVTGATGGIGYETALALCAAGAEVIIAARNADRGREALRKIIATAPGAKVRIEFLDLASLGSVYSFAERLFVSGRPVDLLVNNAAVMTPPERVETENGFEMQFGTNYLGHFVLTGLMLQLLRLADAPRVVTLSSVAARSGVIDFADLKSERAYRPMAAYAQSKLACLLFAFELQRRSDALGWGIKSVAAHPGIARTDLIHNGAGPRSMAGLARSFLWFLFQPAAQGALPVLFAASSPDIKAGGYYGPSGLGETRGYPSEAVPPRQALDTTTAARLWATSERLSGVKISSN